MSSTVHGQVSYSIPEEMAVGSVVGNIAQDLGLELKRLKSGRARVYAGDSTEYIELNKDRGLLTIKERIDREALCGQTTPCALDFQIILENPMELYRITVEIIDVNDNAPTFRNSEKRFEMPESAVVGSKFLLDKAMDLDIGINGLQTYTLKPTENFELKLHSQADGSKKVEMILQKPLDREKQEDISLVLTAMDGGEPLMSGTVKIHITVLDINDNAPVFTKAVYKTVVTENSPKGTVLTSVNAYDADKGSNGQVSYLIPNSQHDVSDLFFVQENGEVILVGDIDYETAKHYEIDVEAVDKGGLSDSSKIIVDVVDVNDNNPTINIISKSSSVNEDSAAGTVIAMISVNDPDSEKNGRVHCVMGDNIAFAIKSTSNGFYSIITDSALDRETDSGYNISVTCSDEGVPSLSSSVTLSLQVSDVNDNAPVFEKSSYAASIVENNTPGISVFSIKAVDADWKQNARVSYILDESSTNGVPISSYVSVDAETGVIRAVRSFDYEQMKDFVFRVKAQDGGSPPLSSNVSVKITIQDQNDNAPQVLYPVHTSGSLVAEMVPRSADVGYLVTKVVAVDVDSGQNAWLSYKLQKMTDRVLFEVGAQNGEIRTIRQITDKDAVKQKLTVVVEDNGQPARSATVNVNVAVADSFPEVLSEFTDFMPDKEYNDNLTFYLVLALAVVSFLFIISIISILSVKCYRWRREQMFYKSNGNLPVIPYYPPLYADAGGTGTLQRVYNYELYRTTDSRKSDVKYGGPCSQSIISLDTGGSQTLPHIQRDRMSTEDLKDQKQLDREKEENMSLLLTAMDGGEPLMSGTVHIYITVLDANDNAPVFTKAVYKSVIPEDSKKGTLVTSISASDVDKGSNGQVSYFISNSLDGVSDLFHIEENGDIVLVGKVDYETAKYYQIDIEAVDNGGLSDSSKIIVDVTDVNDNSPVINIISQSISINEDSPANTVVAMISVDDPDSEKNGEVHCGMNANIPFAIKSTSNGFYSVVTDSALDRETDSQYNITVTCSDEGVPSLSSTITLTLKIADVNDNAPLFEKSTYEASVVENNSPGLSVFTVKAVDADWKQNARVSYILDDSKINGVAVSSYVSVNAESGVIHAVRSFDYEQIKDFQFRVKAQDGGSPPLISNVSVKIVIQDQNDNAPQILYPVQTSSSILAEIVPRSADVGYLVTKVVAVDVDSGQNAWLSYKLVKATDRALFEVGAQNGEIRTVRQVTDKDAMKQKLTVIVEDNGQPSRSATVNVNVAVADSFPEVLSEFTEFTHDKEYNDNLTFYLVLALAVVSFLFVVSLIAILSVKCYRWRRDRMFYKSNGQLPVIPYYPPLYADVGGTGTLQHVYNYEVCRTTDSRKSDLKYSRPSSQSIISLDTSGTLTLRNAQRDKLVMEDQEDQKNGTASPIVPVHHLTWISARASQLLHC
ncbi:protocadherin 2 gamma 28 isoform X3 [Alosa sapidissima]|uniref:protocadherin 2 gamma 28 isoform X3 n=1 Tax=Alosa sapidissima TaxID=34773 RepID=UPI001C09FFE7|nr:protocadherin 2 gamma 28 isoform X3 [Alosa sapidissima]